MVCEVPLSGIKGRGRVALVDDGDWELVRSHKWYLVHNVKHHSPPYAQANIRRPDGTAGTIRMHVLIAGYAGVDHQNHDGLDNRRANLRRATPVQNGANQRAQAGTSKFKGVSWDRQTHRWRAQIMHNRRHRSIGRFTTEEDAARAYDAAARDLFGAYACLNFP